MSAVDILTGMRAGILAATRAIETDEKLRGVNHGGLKRVLVAMLPPDDERKPPGFSGGCLNYINRDFTFATLKIGDVVRLADGRTHALESVATHDVYWKGGGWTPHDAIRAFLRSGEMVVLPSPPDPSSPAASPSTKAPGTGGSVT